MLTPAIRIRVGSVVDLGRKRPEARLVGMDLAGEGESHEGATVEAAGESDDAGPAGIGAGDLDRVLHRLRPGVEEGSLLGGGTGREMVESLGEGDRRLVGSDHEAGMAEAVKLGRHSCLHTRMEMTGVEDSDSTGKIDIATALDIPQLGVASPIDIDRKAGADSTWNRFEAPAMKIGVGGHGLLPGFEREVVNAIRRIGFLRCDGPATMRQQRQRRGRRQRGPRW